MIDLDAHEKRIEGANDTMSSRFDMNAGRYSPDDKGGVE